MMGSEEDAALLVLIHQHLKVSGFREAAQLLEEHVTQVERPLESPNLHDIYTGWRKLCSLAQDSKQEIEIELKTGIVKQEEAADVELDDAGGESKAERLIESSTAETEPETVSEEHGDADETPRSDRGASESDVEEERQETSADTEPISTEASAEASTERKSSICGSSDWERTPEPARGDSDPTNPPETRSSDTAEVSDSESEQEKEEEHELRAAINSPEDTKESSEQIDAVHGVRGCSSQEANVAEENQEEEDEDIERSGQNEFVSSDLMAEDASNQATEREAPPPEDADFGNPQEMRVETAEEPKNDTEEQSDANPAKEETAEVQEDEDDDCIMLNIETNDNEAAMQEPTELCVDSITPRKKKKKKSKRDSAETPQVCVTDTPNTDVAPTDTLGDTPLTSRSKKKKRKNRGRDEMVNGEEQCKTEAAEECEEVSPKKKAKKRKREKEEMEAKRKEVAFPLEDTTKVKKKKLKVVMEDKIEMKGMDEEEVTQKKKRKKEVLQFSEAPAEGEEEETNATADNNLSAKKKKHFRRKLSQKKRLKLRKKEMMMMKMWKTQSPNQFMTRRKRPKLKQKGTEKSPQPKMETSAEREESSSKENHPPRKKKTSVKSILEAPGDQSKGHKKKKIKMREISPHAVVTQLPPAKKKKKDRLIMEPETAPTVSKKKKKSNKKQKTE